jgi:hypothetical protein
MPHRGKASIETSRHTVREVLDCQRGDVFVFEKPAESVGADEDARGMLRP